jgi:hypothetical protein
MLGVFVVTSGWGMATSGGLLATLGAPFLLAISVRWTRIVMRRSKALRRTATVEEGRAG